MALSVGLPFKIQMFLPLTIWFPHVGCAWLR
jgi:hypothetical protein